MLLDKNYYVKFSEGGSPNLRPFVLWSAAPYMPENFFTYLYLNVQKLKRGLYAHPVYVHDYLIDLVCAYSSRKRKR